MAETKSTKKEAPKAKKAPAAPKEEFKFGITDLAKHMTLEPATVRVRLRTAGVRKSGKSYGWNSKGDLEAVAKLLTSVKKEPAAKKEAPKAKKEAPKAKKAA